jgi:BMFP domain-containing protein YqiC
MSSTGPQALIADLQERLSALLRNSPAADLERNLRAVLGQTFQRLDLVTRDEFDAQLERLDRLQARIERLEAELARAERPQP